LCVIILKPNLMTNFYFRGKWTICVLAILLSFQSYFLSAQTISTIAGGIGDNGPALLAKLSPNTVAVDNAGNIYIGDNSRLRKINASTGIITTIAGNGYGTTDTTSGNAIYERIGMVNAIAPDNFGNVYFAHNSTILKLDASGHLTTIIGPVAGYSGDGGPALLARVSSPNGLAVDAAGNLYVSDAGNYRIRRISASGIITTVAGIGTPGNSGDGGSASLAQIQNSYGLALDASGNIYFSNFISGYGGIRKISTSGIISTAFTGGGGYLAIDAAGNIYSGAGAGVGKVSASGVGTTLIGYWGAGFSGDGLLSTNGKVNNVRGLATDLSGNLYIADLGNSRIRKINAAGFLSSIAGGRPYYGFDGDGGPAINAIYNHINDLSCDNAGNTYLVDLLNFRIRKVDNLGIVTTYAGNGVSGYLGDGGPATSASFITPKTIAHDRLGNLYVGDNSSNHVRKISPTGIITTIAGGGLSGLGDGGAATAATITVSGIAIDSFLNVYIADPGNHRVRKINAATGIITTVAGNGTLSYSGDGGPATAAGLQNPIDVAIDNSGALYILDNNTRIRKVDGSGMITTLGGGGTSTADGIPAVEAAINSPNITLDKRGNLFFSGNYTVRYIDKYGYVHTGAGITNTKGYVGDLVPALEAQLWTSTGIAIDTSGNLFISDDDNNTVRKVCCFTGEPDRPPLFTHLAPHMLNLCGTSTVSIDTFLKVSDGDTGDTLKWTVQNPPSHGALSGFIYTQLSTGATVTPTGLQYTPVPGYSGSDVFTIRVSDGKDISTIVINVTFGASPSASITGAGAVCPGDSILLTCSPAGGTWSHLTTHTNVSATGTVYGLTVGTDTIKYTASNSCGTAVASQVVTVNLMPTAATISGPSVMCVGTAITLVPSIPGGTWMTSLSSGGAGVIMSPDGTVTGLAAGTVTISYRITGACGTAITTTDVTVSSTTWPGTLSGSPLACTGGTTTISSSVGGGTWSSSSPAVATVGSSSGIVTGVAPGASIISYTVDGVCGSSSAIAIVNVSSATPIAPITGASSVCAGNTTTLANASAGGTWSSSSPAIASVSSAGVITGHAAGITVISYTASLGCGVSVATFNMVVNNMPDAGILTGPATLCEGISAVVMSSMTGGTWSANNGHATIGATGILTGVSAGADTITYTVTNSCGSASAIYTVNIYPAPNAGTISGASTLCAGTTTVLTDPVAGGIWSSGSTAVATVSSAGALSGLSSGAVIISYTAVTGCGVAVATKAVTVNAPNAGVIGGVTTVCAGGSATLTSSVAGGVWSSSATSVATISSGGVVSAIAGGAAVISYSVTTPCGTDVATVIFTVVSLPVVSPVIGATSVCAGSTTTLNNATIGGVWSSSNPAVAAISGAGVVSGLAAGTTTISYMVTAWCGTAGSTFIMTVNTVPAVPAITGSSVMCETGITTLSASAAGGVWSSNNNAVASVIASAGAVTGVVAGTANITYAISNGCGSSSSSRVVTVSPLPYAGAIFGAASVCMGGAMTLSATIGGGTWTSSNTTVATVSTTGVVSGVGAGAVLISYSKSNSCGTAVATKAVTVNPLPIVDTIVGVSEICAGSAALFTNATGGGVWGSSAPGIASVSSTGNVTGVISGTTTIYYALTTACGTATAARAIAVNSTSAGTITGMTMLCVGNNTTLTSAVTGGTWTSSLGAVATIDAGGIVMAITPGATIISYTVSDVCGTATATTLFTVGTLPNVAPIAGDNIICSGSTTTLTNATSIGSWSSSNTGIASVSSAGLVSGVAPGAVTISCSVTAGCGTASSVFNMLIEGMPAAGSIIGNNSVCKGAATLLSSTVAGGAWYSSDIAVATIGTTGAVTGIATGNSVITYAVTNSCGTDYATYGMAVITVPDAGYVGGDINVCAGSVTNLSANIGGGAWSTANPGVATVAGDGAVTGIAAGTAVISYGVSNVCGTGYATTTIDVKALPHVAPIAGATEVEVGRRVTLMDAVTGGVWSSSDPEIATVDNSGIVMGQVAGIAVISYTIINDEGCMSVAVARIKVGELNSGIHGTFNIYPNPAKNELTVAWENQYATYADVVITDMLGQFVYGGFIDMPEHKGQVSLDTKNLVPGTYIINIKYAGDFFSSKLVIVK
jgi:sugar lactone lactonase YvrE/uncharacterized protein YjdB